VDDIATDAGLSPAERAERVRPLREQYARHHSGLIPDMIADLLHLTAAEGGDPLTEVQRALTHYGAERGRVYTPGSTWS
jgi:hypothetical protein